MGPTASPTALLSSCLHSSPPPSSRLAPHSCTRDSRLLPLASAGTFSPLSPAPPLPGSFNSSLERVHYRRTEVVSLVPSSPTMLESDMVVIDDFNAPSPTPQIAPPPQHLLFGLQQPHSISTTASRSAGAVVTTVVSTNAPASKTHQNGGIVGFCRRWLKAAKEMSFGSGTVGREVVADGKHAGEKHSRVESTKSSDIECGHSNSIRNISPPSPVSSTCRSSRSSGCCSRVGFVWTVGCGIFLIFLLVFLPILFCVVVPGIVRSAVETSTFSLTSVTARNPHSDRVTLDVESLLNRQTSIGGTIRELVLTVEWQEQAIGLLTLPETVMAGSQTRVRFTDVLKVDDRDAWDGFLTQVIKEGEAEWRLRGEVAVSAIGMTFSNIPFDKTLLVKGPPMASSAHSSSGTSPPDEEKLFRIIDMDLSSSTIDEVNLSLEVEYNNIGKSNIIPLGDVQLSMFYKEVYIGPLFGKDLSVYQGTNTYRFNGQLDPWSVLQNLGGGAREDMRASITSLMEELVSAAIGGEGGVAVVAKGVGGSIELYQAGIRALEMETKLSGMGGGMGREVLEDLSFSGFELLEIPNEPNKVQVKSAVIARIVNPLGYDAPLYVEQVEFSGELREGKTTGPLIGLLTSTLTANERALEPNTRQLLLPHTSITSAYKRALLPSSSPSSSSSSSSSSSASAVSRSPLDYGVVMEVPFTMDGVLELIDGGDALNGLVRSMIEESRISLVVANTKSKVNTRSALGDLQLVGLRMDGKTIDLEGFGGMSGVKLQKYKFTGTGPDGEWLMEAVVDIPSKSPSIVHLGDLMLELLYENTHMGILKSVGPVTITEGNNHVELRGLFDPDKGHAAAVSDLFGSYVNGRDTFLDVQYVEHYKESTAFTGLFASEESEGGSEADINGISETAKKHPTASSSRPPRWISEGLKSLSMRFPMPRDIMTLSSTSQEGSPSGMVDETDSISSVGGGIRSAAGMVQGAKVDGLELIPVGASEISVRGSLTVEIVNPLGSAVPIDVYSIGIDVGLITSDVSEHEEQSSSKKRFGTLKMAPTKELSQSSLGENRIMIVLRLNGTLEVEGDGSAFAEYVKQIQEKDMVELELDGKAQVKLTTTLGLLNLGDIVVRTHMDVKGFGGNLMGGNSPEEGGEQKISNMLFVGREHEFGQGVGFEADYELIVPSSISIYLGTVHFAMIHGGVRFGRFKINNMTLKNGRNNLKIFGVLDPSEADLATVSDIFSRYLAGEEVKMEVIGTDAYLDSGEQPLWLNTTVRTVKQLLSLPKLGGVVGNSFSDVTVDGMGLSATSDKLRGMEDEAVVITANVAATVSSPFGKGSPILVRKASIRMEVYWENGADGGSGVLMDFPKERIIRRKMLSSGIIGKRRRLQENKEHKIGTHLGSLSVVGMPVEHVGQEVQMSLREALLEFSDGGENFAALALRLMNSTQRQKLALVGAVDVVVDSDIGRLALANLPIETKYGFDGLDVFGKEGGGGSGSMVGDAMKNLKVEDMTVIDGYVTDGEKKASGGALKLTSNLSLDNRSTMEVDLGSLFLDVFYRDTSLGTLGIPSFHMRSGTNDLPILGAIKPTDMDVFSGFVSDYISGEKLTLTVKGKVSDQDEFGEGISSETIAKQLVLEEGGAGGGTSPLWLRRVLQGIEMQVDIVGLQDGNFINGAALDRLDVDLSGVGFPIISGRISANYKLPEQFAISHEILRVDSDLDMKLLPRPPSHAQSSPLPLPRLLGSMHLRGLQPESSGTDAEAAVVFELSETTLEVPDESEEVMSQFFSDVMHSSDESKVEVSGVGSVLMRTALGDIHVKDIPIELQQTIQHYGDATRSGELFKMKDMQITSGTPDGLMLSSQLQLQLPGSKSKLGVHLGDVLFDMWLNTGEQGVDVRNVERNSRELFKGGNEDGGGGNQFVQVGLVQVPSFKMIPGEQAEMNAKAVLLRPIMGLDGESMKVGVRTVLSRYVSGEDTEIVIRGNKSSVVNKYLSKAFEQYNSKFLLKGSEEPMLKNVELDIKFVIFIPQIEAKSTMENPLPVPIEFRYANMTTYNADKLLGTMAVDYRANPNIIPAHSVHTLPAVRVVPKFEGGAMEIFRELLSGAARIHAVGYMEISIDRYAITLDVDMDNVPLSF
eukprot:GHVS01014358.1.p1 GENE.GHVS01014358.1~~GHVS01014358.1.p1  ORF type:complete len:2197 (-),score=380.89 GHVS01014358.1:402-6764(-)